MPYLVQIGLIGPEATGSAVFPHPPAQPAPASPRSLASTTITELCQLSPELGWPDYYTSLQEPQYPEPPARDILSSALGTKSQSFIKVTIVIK